MSKVAVIGAGYVGLTTAACLASLGHDIWCADIDEERVNSLNRGEIPILEEGMENLVNSGLADGNLRFVHGSQAAAAVGDICFLCVPTPQGEDGAADLSYIEMAANEIASVLPHGAIVVNKSTVPVGSTHTVARALGRADVAVVSNPEFLREGSAVHDFLNPDRVVVGADDREAAAKVASLYLKLSAPTLVTDAASAETIKYASNSFLAAKVSFANAVAAVCEAVGADVQDVLLGVGYDNRIGSQFLRPGPGWGGSCFPKDVLALIHIADQVGYDFSLLKGVLRVNEEQRDRVVEKITRAVCGDLNGTKVAVWGLTFKAGTDDLRESPSLRIIAALRTWGAEIHAYDPAINEQRAKRTELDSIVVAQDPYSVCDGADALVVLTEWDEFRWKDFEKVAGLLSSQEVVDARNLLDVHAVRRAGLGYQGIGRN
jgi:UDPglucose 6-dehydrogenase